MMWWLKLGWFHWPLLRLCGAIAHLPSSCCGQGLFVVRVYFRHQLNERAALHTFIQNSRAVIGWQDKRLSNSKAQALANNICHAYKSWIVPTRRGQALIFRQPAFSGACVAGLRLILSYYSEDSALNTKYAEYVGTNVSLLRSVVRESSWSTHLSPSLPCTFNDDPRTCI